VADPKHEETFKVIDRRLFTEDGVLRKDIVEDQERREEEAAEKAAARAASAAAEKVKSPAGNANAATATTTGAEASSATDELSPEPEAGADADQQQSSRSFQMLVDFLVRNAAAMLGGMADPRTGQAYLDLEGAREVIDMLDTLREKTRGNLSKADDDLLVEVLGQLKLTFMEMSKVAADAMAKKAAQKK
jgi:Domain of unknown function (DUF1844)